jgi:hypothetical protein
MPLTEGTKLMANLTQPLPGEHDHEAEEFCARILWEAGYTAGKQSRQQEIDDLTAALTSVPQQREPG